MCLDCDAVLVEMFLLFNTLTNKNVQIVFSSDKPPAQLEKMEDRIRTRLNSGVLVDIQKPSNDDMRIVSELNLHPLCFLCTDNGD